MRPPSPFKLKYGCDWPNAVFFFFVSLGEFEIECEQGELAFVQFCVVV